MTDELVFIDTNVLLYAHDRADKVKYDTATSILRRLWATDTGVLSTQVLQEFYSVATRKFTPPMSRAEARELVARYSEWCSVNTDPLLIISASRIEEEHTTSWWDALIIQAALRSGARTLLSEDLQDGRRFGWLTVVNPFGSG